MQYLLVGTDDMILVSLDEIVKASMESVSYWQPCIQHKKKSEIINNKIYVWAKVHPTNEEKAEQLQRQEQARDEADKWLKLSNARREAARNHLLTGEGPTLQSPNVQSISSREDDDSRNVQSTEASYLQRLSGARKKTTSPTQDGERTPSESSHKVYSTASQESQHTDYRIPGAQPSSPAPQLPSFTGSEQPLSNHEPSSTVSAPSLTISASSSTVSAPFSITSSQTNPRPPSYEIITSSPRSDTPIKSIPSPSSQVISTAESSIAGMSSVASTNNSSQSKNRQKRKSKKTSKTDWNDVPPGYDQLLHPPNYWEALEFQGQFEEGESNSEQEEEEASACVKPDENWDVWRLTDNRLDSDNEN
ncbi:uncharacterized protein [Clytia hemisphaerica]|uniref:uncharacterized protein n=1 Tax=Clytia hemisphaerica TaxID=252671 RepID=UPI0034D3B042